MGEDEAVIKEEATVEEVDALNAPIARGWATLKKIVILCMVSLTK